MATLVFIATFLFAVFSLISLVVYLIRGKRVKARNTAIRLLEVLAVYAVALMAFSLLSQNSILPLGHDKCFDDWCAAVTRVDKIVSTDTTDYRVTLRISNHGKGRAQRPDHPHIYVVDTHDARDEESAAAQSDYEKQSGVQAPINELVQPGASYKTVMVFRLASATQWFLVITEGGFPTPLIIGDEGSLLHKKSIIPLD